MGILLNRKSIFLLVLSCWFFLFAYSASAATLIRPPNNLGLIGYWNFNEGTSTLATDLSGEGNHGTLVSMAAPATPSSGWTSNGKLLGGLNFDGTGDHVRVKTGVIAATQPTSTVSLWFKTSATTIGGGYPIYGERGSSGNDIYKLDYGDGGSVSEPFFTWRNDAGNLNGIRPITVGGYNDNKWHHVTVTIDGNAALMYIDGVSVGGATLAAKNFTDPGLESRIGADTTAHFPGSIDEVRIYNRALSAVQVAALYRSGASQFGSSNTLTQSSLNQGLKGHWTFDGKDMAPNVRDVSGNGNHGILYSGTGSFWPSGTTSVAGKLGQALSWTVIDLGINVLSAASLDDLEDQGGGGVTGTAWIYRNSGGSIMIAENDCHIDSGTGRWRFYANGSGGLDFCKQFATTNLRVISGNSFVPAQTWTHIAYTWDGSNAAANVHFFVNGTEVTSYTTQTNGSGAKESDASNNKFIGNGVFSGQEDYLGYMDDVRIYNRILSVSEIKQLYNIAQGKINASSTALLQGTSLKDGLVGLWTFDGQDTAPAIMDRSGQGNNGQFFGGATSSAKTIGKLGQAFAFDGVDDYVQLSALSNLGGVNAPLTVSSWFKQTNTVGNQNIIDIVSANDRYQVGSRGSSFGPWKFGGVFWVSTTSPAINVWHHFASVYDGTTHSLYIDGVLVAAAASSLNTAGIATSTAPRIGNISTSGTEYFNGAIDDIRLYNRALSAGEVKQLYLGGN